MNLAYIIKRPMITEKSMRSAKSRKYTFVVDSRAIKGQIKAAVSEFFKVEVLSVKTIKVADERKRKRGRRGFATVAGYKKAIVELPAGQKIELFETEETKELKSKATKEQKNKTVNEQMSSNKGKGERFRERVAGIIKGKGKGRRVETIESKESKVRKSGDK